MRENTIFHRWATMGLAIACVGLTACTTPPTDASNQSSAAASPAASGVAPGTASGAMTPQKIALRKDLATVGVEVSDTPEGRIKLSIPSDSSFALGSATVKSSAAKLLNELADVLNKYPNTNIEILGHTDASGSDAINLPLSTKRAESTRNYLVGRKVGADRFTVLGAGSSEPMADNKTAAGRATNRRVEVFINER